MKIADTIIHKLSIPQDFNYCGDIKKFFIEKMGWQKVYNYASPIGFFYQLIGYGAPTKLGFEPETILYSTHNYELALEISESLDKRDVLQSLHILYNS